MTNREFFQNVIAFACNSEDTVNGVSAHDLIAHAQEAIAKLDATLAKRAEKPTKAQEANKPVAEAIMKAFDENPNLVVTASSVANGAGISVQRASAILRGLVADKKLVGFDAKVKVDGKRRKAKCYLLPKVEEAVEETASEETSEETSEE